MVVCFWTTLLFCLANRSSMHYFIAYFYVKTIPRAAIDDLSSTFHYRPIILFYVSRLQLSEWPAAYLPIVCIVATVRVRDP